MAVIELWFFHFPTVVLRESRGVVGGASEHLSCVSVKRLHKGPVSVFRMFIIKMIAREILLSLQTQIFCFDGLAHYFFIITRSFWFHFA